MSPFYTPYRKGTLAGRGLIDIIIEHFSIILNIRHSLHVHTRWGTWMQNRDLLIGKPRLGSYLLEQVFSHSCFLRLAEILGLRITPARIETCIILLFYLIISEILPLTIFTKCCISDVWQGTDYTSVIKFTLNNV